MVDPHVARLESQRRLDAQFLLDRRVIHPCLHPSKLLVTKGTILITNVAYIESEFW